MVLNMKIIAINKISRNLKMKCSEMPKAPYSRRCTQYDTESMKTNALILILYILAINISFSQRAVIENNEWKLSIAKNGTIKSLLFKPSKSTINFSDNNFLGPSWYLEVGEKVIEPSSTQVSQNKYSTKFGGINLSIEYKDDNGKLLILASIKNNQHTPFQPNKLGLRLGINTYMDKYPDWEDKLFPTLLRCESTHFWGYFMGTTGKILAIASPDPIASWSHNYSKSWGEPPYLYNGHRITSVNLDLINALPLPKRHPQDLWQILPGESKTFRIYLDEVDDLSNLYKKITKLTYAPTIDIASTSCEKGGEINFSVLMNEEVTVEVFSPNGESVTLQSTAKNNIERTYTVDKTIEEGLYLIKVLSKNGKQSEATFYVRKPYSWYMQKAMQAVVDYPQKASTSHNESWYGFYTTFAGGKHFPENETIAKANAQFNKIFPLVIDTTNYEPVAFKYRIQNVSSMIGILVDRYQLFKDENDLQRALKLSEFLLDIQTPDGAFRRGKIHYTSVVYTAKSLMELLEVLEPFKKEKRYRESYKKISISVKMAMDELELNRSDIQTEGELTFEDGMISCSALQLGQFALLQTNNKTRDKYKVAAIDLLTQHQCLEQLAIPDARMRSGSLRFWEAQYDVLMNNNFFNSPHGWSSWSTYANYYVYLLTGEIKYLIRTFNGLDAAMQMIDISNGKLRWAFAVNPSLKIIQINTNLDGATPLDFKGIHYHADQYPNHQYIIGEQYVDMVSDWFFANANDNDVHEHFKCLEEVALSKAYVAETKDGELIAYNCSAILKDREIHITPSESMIDKVHINLKSEYTVVVKFNSKTVTKIVKPQMIWLTVDE